MKRVRTTQSKIIQCFCLATLFLVFFIGCKNATKHNGFTLQRFEIVNKQLNSVIQGMTDSTHILKQSDDVIVMVLRIYNSNPEFCFASTKKDKLNEYFIFSSNSRIVGYIENKHFPNPIIVLSEIDNIVDFEMTFYKFLVPTDDKKCLDYIYFPDNQYSVDSRGFGPPPPLFDPYFYYFTYINQRIIPATYSQ